MSAAEAARRLLTRASGWLRLSSHGGRHEASALRPSPFTVLSGRDATRHATTASASSASSASAYRSRRLHAARWALLPPSLLLAGWGATTASSSDLDEELDEGLPLHYDVRCIQAYWNRRPLDVGMRAAAIGREVLPYATGLWRDHLEDKQQPQLRAVEMREMLTRLGPTFIKLGQMLCTRPDLIPPAFIYELQKLCDAVPSFPTPIALETIDAELRTRGQSVVEVFSDLDADTVPYAAASLGQVYRVHLHSGECVAVKVQRPDMIRQVSLDLYLLRRYMRCVELAKHALTVMGVLNQPHPYDVELLDSFAAASYLELDYRHEAQSQARFRRELVPLMRGAVYVPEVKHHLTTRKVLVSEWVDGTQLAKSSPEVINKLVPIGVECFLSQLLVLKYFHSDPHPGNLLVNARGQLVILDFGLCASINAPDSDTITHALVHLMHGDVPSMLQDAIALGFLARDVDTTTLLPALQRVFAQGAAMSAHDDASATSSASKYKAARRRKQLHALSADLNEIFFHYPFQVPSYFALITRALIVLEGIALSGDPDFDLFAAAMPFARRRALQLLGTNNVGTVLAHTHADHDSSDGHWGRFWRWPLLWAGRTRRNPVDEKDVGSKDGAALAATGVVHLGIRT